MGTRSLIVVRVNNKVKVAQYCQWDGYPTGQGKDIAKFLRKVARKEKLDLFKKKVSSTKWVSDKYIESLYVHEGADGVGYGSYEAVNAANYLYPEFSRDTGAGVLDLVYRHGVDKLYNSYSFLKDSLFCEYAYDINLDKKTVSVYMGGKKPYKVFKFKDFTIDAMKKLEREIRED
jgi:hypothetical protein